jgi:formylglycine-generating enzyme required for sulfatase activity
MPQTNDRAPDACDRDGNINGDRHKREGLIDVAGNIWRWTKTHAARSMLAARRRP